MCAMLPITNVAMMKVNRCIISTVIQLYIIIIIIDFANYDNYTSFSPIISEYCADYDLRYSGLDSSNSNNFGYYYGQIQSCFDGKWYFVTSDVNSRGTICKHIGLLNERMYIISMLMNTHACMYLHA